jgi:hypothetical protein
METIDTGVVEVSQIIDASAESIFQIIAESQRHPDFDGSGMLRESDRRSPLNQVGDQFVMSMHNEEFGDYEMVNYVIEFEKNRRISWAPTRGPNHPEGGSELPPDGPAEISWTYVLTPKGPKETVVTEIYDCSHAPEDLRRVLRNGERWRANMTTSLERLVEICSDDPGESHEPLGSE